MQKIPAFFLLAIMIACKKDSSPPPKSAEKVIVSFVLRFSDNPGLFTANVQGVIVGDTIKLGVQPGVPLTSLVPHIIYKGADITPQSQVIQNFSSPVQYTVTAEDGTTRKYTVIAKNLATTKEITGFQFKTTDNPGAITSDISGEIKADTIWVNVPYTPGITSLKPLITHNGESISPASLAPKDFTQPVVYTVAAEDGTVRYYTVIVRYNLGVYFGSNDGYIYALDATTGKLQWKYNTGKPIGCAPVVNNGILYAVGGSFLYALDAATGAFKWEANTTYGISTSPFVHNGAVFVGSSGAQHHLHSFNAATGNNNWSKPIGYSIVANPVVDGSIVIVGDAGYGTIALNISDGSTAWSYNSGITSGGAALVNGTVFVGGETHKLIKLDAATGQFRSQYTDGALGSGTAPTISSGTAYICSYDKHVVAIDTAGMTFKWKYKVTNGGFFGSPVVANGIVYAGNSDTYLYAIDANTGTTRWMFGNSHHQDPSIGIINPTVVNGIVYCGNYDKKFYALNASSGTIKWSFETGAPVYSGPCVLEANNKLNYPGASGHQQ